MQPWQQIIFSRTVTLMKTKNCIIWEIKVWWFSHESQAYFFMLQYHKGTEEHFFHQNVFSFYCSSHERKKEIWNMFRRKKFCLAFEMSWRKLEQKWYFLSDAISVLYVCFKRKQSSQRHFERIFFLVCFMLFNNDENRFFKKWCLRQEKKTWREAKKLLKAYKSSIETLHLVQIEFNTSAWTSNFTKRIEFCYRKMLSIIPFFFYLLTFQ